MEWSPLISTMLSGVFGLLVVLVSKWLDARSKRVSAQAAAAAGVTRSEAETARSFYTDLLHRYDALQRRNDELEQSNNVLEAKLAREQRAREQADDLCEAHNAHLTEIYIAGQARFPTDWQPFLNNLRTPRPPQRSGRGPSGG